MTTESVLGSAPQLAVEFDDQPHNDAWDTFVESVPAGHHEQTSRWGQVRAQTGWEVSRVVVRQNTGIVAGVQLQSRVFRRLGRIAYITYGPCLRAEDPVVARMVIAGLKQQARHKGIRMMVLGLPYGGEYLLPTLVAAGFQRKPARLHPHFLEATAVINLTQEPEQLLAAMRRSTRRNVRYSLKHGITVVEQSEAGLSDFYQLMLALCRRRNITPNPAGIEFFTALWRHFQTKGWIRLFFAMHGSEPVSAALAFSFGDWFRVWKVGWSGQLGHLKPNEALWWQMILWARQNGYRSFDFVGVDPAEIKRMADGNAEPNSNETVTAFKMGFGGKYLEIPCTSYYLVNPVLRNLIPGGVSRWLDSPLAARVLGKLVRNRPGPRIAGTTADPGVKDSCAPAQVIRPSIHAI